MVFALNKFAYDPLANRFGWNFGLLVRKRLLMYNGENRSDANFSFALGHLLCFCFWSFAWICLLGNMILRKRSVAFVCLGNRSFGNRFFGFQPLGFWFLLWRFLPFQNPDLPFESKGSSLNGKSSIALSDGLDLP